MALRTTWLLAAAASLYPASAFAADKLSFGAPPSWVVQHQVPTAIPSEQPVKILLNDEQVSFDGGKIASYNELAFKIQKPEGLGAGSLSISWQPATDTMWVSVSTDRSSIAKAMAIAIEAAI